MTLVSRLKESNNVERCLALPSVGLWRNYCFFLMWRWDFSAYSQGQAVDMFTSAWASSACLHNRFPVRMWRHVEWHIQKNTGTSSCDCSRLLYGHLECDSPIFIGAKDLPTRFAEKKKIKRSFYVENISHHVWHFSRTLNKVLVPQYGNFGTKFYYILRGRSLTKPIFFTLYVICQTLTVINCKISGNINGNRQVMRGWFVQININVYKVKAIMLLLLLMIMMMTVKWLKLMILLYHNVTVNEDILGLLGRVNLEVLITQERVRDQIKYFRRKPQSVNNH